MPLAELAAAAPAPPGGLARAIKALATKGRLVLANEDGGIVVRLPPEPPKENKPVVAKAATPRYEKGSGEYRAVGWLRAAGQEVSEASVAARVAAVAKAKRARARKEKTQATWREEAEAKAPEVVAYVRKVREETGAGPVWWQVAMELHWFHWGEHDYKIRHLAKVGWLVTTPEARSLDVGPRATAPAAPGPTSQP